MSTETLGNPAARELGYCPCCGYLTLPEGQPGSYEVCDICDWTDDPRQFLDAEHAGSANDVSLSEARKNFEEIGAATPEAVAATRDPGTEKRDPNWPY
jgi:hypothetical protein